jgi:hypothetical protein
MSKIHFAEQERFVTPVVKFDTSIILIRIKNFSTKLEYYAKNKIAMNLQLTSFSQIIFKSS